ncbi:COG3650 family protein [Trichormus variabilis]|uniref:Uncharacterized protein n=1 Tax=Trichormus variabilis SAG 1403-4b TaxID=447716 RepID=A0A433V1M1_ANAVA|nr:hypothetical protein [Trichormus variabilis]MBD2627223.1 hypothetical protein [Trichormus variabilis FACHB-164]RUS99980.1 hypothetical protein DSM107003_05640 [Trichormus variabilis SAG 1403-4b]
MRNLIFFLSILGIASNLLVSDQSIAQSSKIEEFTVVGNEPFWNITVTKRGIVYNALGKKQQTFPYTAPLSAQGRPIDKVRVYQLKGKEKNILILNRVNNCNDTMSDKKYPYSAIFIMGNKVLEGCAGKK